MADEEFHINMCGAGLSPYSIAQIVTALETHGSIKVTNCAKPALGPGMAAMTLGAMLQRGGFLNEPKETD